MRCGLATSTRGSWRTLVVSADKMSGLDTPGVTKALGGASYQKEENGMSFPATFAVRFRASVQVNDVLPLSGKDVVAFEGRRCAIAQAYAEAGIGVDDLSLAEVHDCFTIAELLSVEALQLAEPGRGRDAVIGGQTRRDGQLPVNLSGGLKAKGHPVGATGVSMHVLNARQLVCQAAAMQLPGAELAMAVNMGGGAVTTYATALERVK